MTHIKRQETGTDIPAGGDAKARRPAAGRRGEVAVSAPSSSQTTSDTGGKRGGEGERERLTQTQ
eukprot:4092632-Pyramimonas_sp.AAC.1